MNVEDKWSELIIIISSPPGVWIGVGVLLPVLFSATLFLDEVPCNRLAAVRQVKLDVVGGFGTFPPVVLDTVHVIVSALMRAGCKKKMKFE